MAETRDDIEETMFQIRLEELKAMPDGPDKDEAIAQLSQDYEGKEAIIAEELSFAQGLMDAPKTQGVQAGGQYVAGSGAGHLADALRTGIGAYGRKKAMGEKRDLSDARSKGLAAFFQSAASGGPKQPMSDMGAVGAEIAAQQAPPVSAAPPVKMAAPTPQPATPAAAPAPQPQMSGYEGDMQAASSNIPPIADIGPPPTRQQFGYEGDMQAPDPGRPPVQPQAPAMAQPQGIMSAQAQILRRAQEEEEKKRRQKELAASYGGGL